MPIFLNDRWRPVRAIPALLICIAGIAVQGCAARDTVYNPSHFRWSGQLVPPDIVLQEGGPAGTTTDGLYAENAADDSSSICCWIKPHATLRIVKRDAATTLRIGAWIPDNHRFRTHPQELRIRFNGFGPARSVRLQPGVNNLRLDLPPALAKRRGEFVITVDSKYDLKEGPVNPGDLRYGVLVPSVYFE